MPEEIRDRIVRCLAHHRHMDLATVTSQGTPQTHPVGYWSDNAVVYFLTLATSRKAGNIARNPKVAYTVADDHEDWDRMQAIQMEGEAEILADEQEIEQIHAHLVAKFPRLSRIPERSDAVIVRVRPRICHFLDHTKGWGHLEHVTY